MGWFYYTKNQPNKESEVIIMITLNKYADTTNRAWLELYGLSTDIKPIKKFGTTYIGNASTYLEMDTGKFFIYDEENHKWYEWKI